MGNMCDNFIIYEDNKNEFQIWQGLVGAHFTPHVDELGNLSWTNNGDLPNPETVNVSGRGLTIAGIVATTGDLPETATNYDTYLVGTATPYHGYIYDDGSWYDLGVMGVGEPAGFGTPTATIDGGTGIPSVTITASGDNTAKVFAFAFSNLKGADGQGVPTGGTTGQVLKKKSNTNYDTEWGSVEALPTGGTTGQALVKHSNTNYDVEWADVGGGDVQTVNSVQPDANGNVLITASNIGTNSNGISVQNAIDDAVHVGTSAPTDPTCKIWLDTDEPGMSAVSSVNGATGAVVLDIIPLHLLCENASKTSAFSAQTISIDLSSYTAVLIEVVTNAAAGTSSVLYQFGSMIVTKGTHGNVTAFLPYNGNLFNYFRNATVQDNGVVFSGGTANGGESNNAYAVPTRIYGIKGVQTS